MISLPKLYKFPLHKRGEKKVELEYGSKNLWANKIFGVCWLNFCGPGGILKREKIDFPSRVKKV